MGKTKGSTVLTPVKLLRGRREEALKVLPPQLHHYLEERIVVASWYPEDDVIGLIKACSVVLPIPGDNIYETMGAGGARVHLEGIYAHLLGRDLGARAHTLWKTQHDSGELVVSGSTPESATYTLTGWDHAAREYCRLLGAYFTEVHRLDGAAEPRFDHPKCRAFGGDCCVWTVRWKPS
jgi:hypothetical protein